MRFAVGRRLARGLAVWALVAGALVLGSSVGQADEQRVSRLGLTIYAMPTSLALSDFNRQIRLVNQQTEQFDLAPIHPIHAGAMFGVEGKFFATRSLAVTAGFGRIKRSSTLDLLPQV